MPTNTSPGSGPAPVLQNSNFSPLAGPAIDVASNPTFNSQGQPIPTTYSNGQPANPISADTLNSGNQSPLAMPSTPASTPSTSPTVSQPTNITVGENGTVTPNPSTTVTQPNIETKTNNAGTTQSWIMQQMEKIFPTLANEGQETQDIQNAAGLDTKAHQATIDYNAYITAKTNLENQIATIQENKSGMSAEGVNQAVAEANRVGTPGVSNLALHSQLSQGFYDDAQKTVTNNINNLLQPVKDQMDFLKSFLDMNNNDLSESEKIQIQERFTTQQDNLKTVQDAATDVHKAMMSANAPASAYGAIDTVLSDYSSGKITAQEAENQIYEAGSGYGMSAAEKQTLANTTTDLDIKKATFNATYGNFVNSNGSPNTSINPTDIQGYTKLPDGTSVINSFNLPTGLDKRNNIGGIPVVTPVQKQTLQDVGNLNVTMNNLLSQYTALSSNSNPNKAGDTNITAYNNAVTAFNNQITALSKTAPYAALSGLSLPKIGMGIFGIGQKDFGSTMSQIRTTLGTIYSDNSGGQSALKYGQIFSTPQDAQKYFTSTGQTDAYNSDVATANQLANKYFGRNANDGEILQIINGQ